MKTKLLIFFGFFIAAQVSFGQNCTLKVQGVVLDKPTLKPLEYSNIYIEETGGGAATDSTGFFILPKLCPGHYHFRISHIGCEPTILYVDLHQDTSLQILLEHNKALQEIEVVGDHHEHVELQTHTHISESAIEQESGKALGEILESITGVSTLNNGSGISKPIIHGLYGNRISILNNGVPQAGQQWGNDHAPEIDPNTAAELTVVKGVSAIQYGGSSLGGLVLVEPSSISNDPHLHGNVNYGFESNGLSNTLAAKLEQSTPFVDWRINATVKVGGDKRTADYYLNNTGSQVYSTALQLNKIIKDKWSINGYYSYYKTNLGILRGSHIGNVTDLEMAIERDEPFFTEDKFSYGIESPKQEVQHHLAKLKVGYFQGKHRLKFTYAAQVNQRKEFDVRRSGRSDIPALSLTLVSNFIETTYQYKHEKFTINTGFQAIIEDNTNQPETGILPLIPDYDQQKIGTYFTFQKPIKKWLFEIGGRYDFRNVKALTITNSLPRAIEILKNQYHDYAFTGNIQYRPSSNYNTQLILGSVKRSPAINELYSYGLHQGVSGIERGDTSLQAEQSFKSIWSHQIHIKNKFFIEVSAYVQYVKNYIYLEPQDELELTIRGAFPVYLYRHTNAILSGLDLFTEWEISDHWNWNAKFAMVRGIDKKNQWPLIYMPSDKISTEVAYTFKAMKKMEHLSVALNGSYTFEQKQFEESLDFLEPPSGYFLLGFEVSSRINLEKVMLKWQLSAENLLNTSYRDYLNRLRYYADEEGINVRVGLQVVF